jgi:hypothetical protein
VSPSRFCLAPHDFPGLDPTQRREAGETPPQLEQFLVHENPVEAVGLDEVADMSRPRTQLHRQKN